MKLPLITSLAKNFLIIGSFLTFCGVAQSMGEDFIRNLLAQEVRSEVLKQHPELFKKTEKLGLLAPNILKDFFNSSDTIRPLSYKEFVILRFFAMQKNAMKAVQKTRMEKKLGNKDLDPEEKTRLESTLADLKNNKDSSDILVFFIKKNAENSAKQLEIFKKEIKDKKELSSYESAKVKLLQEGFYLETKNLYEVLIDTDLKKSFESGNVSSLYVHPKMKSYLVPTENDLKTEGINPILFIGLPSQHPFVCAALEKIKKNDDEKRRPEEEERENNLKKLLEDAAKLNLDDLERLEKVKFKILKQKLKSMEKVLKDLTKSDEESGTGE